MRGVEEGMDKKKGILSVSVEFGNEYFKAWLWLKVISDNHDNKYMKIESIRRHVRLRTELEDGI